MARKQASELKEAAAILAPLKPPPEPHVPWRDRQKSYATAMPGIKKLLRGSTEWTRERVVAHWQAILASPGSSAYAQRGARDALANLSRGFDEDREPGQDG